MSTENPLEKSDSIEQSQLLHLKSLKIVHIISADVEFGMDTKTLLLNDGYLRVKTYETCLSELNVLSDSPTTDLIIVNNDIEFQFDKFCDKIKELSELKSPDKKYEETSQRNVLLCSDFSESYRIKVVEKINGKTWIINNLDKNPKDFIKLVNTILDCGE